MSAKVNNLTTFKRSVLSFRFCTESKYFVKYIYTAAFSNENISFAAGKPK